MKLRKVSKKPAVTFNRTPLDDMYHCCRYCSYYEHGKCYNPYITRSYSDVSNPIYRVAEEGRLNAVVEESIGETLYKEIKNLLEFHGVSKKSSPQIMEDVQEEIESKLETLQYHPQLSGTEH